MNKTLQILDITSVSVDTELYNVTAINRDNSPYWVEFIKPHFNEIGISIDILPLTKINFLKKWIVNVDINGWNWDAYSGDILERFDKSIQHEIRYGNAYLILNHQCESYTQSFLKQIYKHLTAAGIPNYKIIYMVAAADIEREHNTFVLDNNIQHKISVMYVHHVYKRLSTFNLKSFKYDKHAKKEKKYLSLNRRWHDHRLMLTSLLSYYDLLEHGYVSLGVMQNEISQAKNNISKYTKFIDGFNKFETRLPLQVDLVDLSINQFQINSLPIEFYQQSCFSIVSSTMALADQEGSVGFTEKEVKPILAKHPFIIHNRPGVIKHLKNLGFLTFEKWFDESYDLEENDITRLEMIVAEVKRLCNLSFNEWKIMLDDMEPILEHNYNRMVNYTTEHCYFNSDLKKLLYYVN
jgi:hypothetical protein